MSFAEKSSEVVVKCWRRELISDTLSAGSCCMLIKAWFS